jgi:hydrogenase/urease accessory protein HupE
MQFYLDLLTQWGDCMLTRLLTLAAALVLAPAAALAHPGPVGHMHGFADSLGSLDLLMAIAAVGIFALAWRANQLTR